MAAWFETLGAPTPEEAARRRFGLWSLGMFILLLPPWWLWGADLAAAGLRPVAGLVFRLLGLTGEISLAADGGWTVGTRLTSGGVPVNYDVAQTAIRRLLLGFPLAVAFLTAPPRTPHPLKAAVVTTLVLTLLFTLSLTALIWGDLAAQLNPALAPPSAGGAPPLDQPPLPAIVAQIAIIGRYIGMSVAPLIATVLLWAALNPAGRSVVMADDSLKS
ncbi:MULTISPECIES: exosortase H-associated membrane protein [unclassified Brevundimonas]|uniref:exosortase H-associated membrane protein n=1 Tax=unclassified Brevundimonas TaxID=2622653 RepID=UPI003F8FCC37